MTLFWLGFAAGFMFAGEVLMGAIVIWLWRLPLASKKAGSRD